MGWPEDNKGGHKGRKKGSKNKQSAAMKECFLQVFEMRGGVPALLAWSESNPDEFYRLCGKLLPKQVDVDVNGTIQLASVIEKARKRAVQR